MLALIAPLRSAVDFYPSLFLELHPRPPPVQFKEERGMKIHLMPDLATLKTEENEIPGWNVGSLIRVLLATLSSIQGFAGSEIARPNQFRFQEDLYQHGMLAPPAQTDPNEDKTFSIFWRDGTHRGLGNSLDPGSEIFPCVENWNIARCEPCQIYCSECGTGLKIYINSTLQVQKVPTLGPVAISLATHPPWNFTLSLPWIAPPTSTPANSRKRSRDGISHDAQSAQVDFDSFLFLELHGWRAWVRKFKKERGMKIHCGA